MSLIKKITLSFLISASIIGILVVLEYVSFLEIRKEIKRLEFTDTIRSKTLQLRRHEKNFFLYGPQKSADEAKSVHDYLKQIDGIIGENLKYTKEDDSGELLRLRALISAYGRRFTLIESEAQGLVVELEKEKATSKDLARLYPLVELTFLERPKDGADYLEGSSLLSSSKIADGLRVLDGEINALRKDGEDLIALSKDLDKSARDSADRAIRVSQAATIVIFPIFIFVGIGTLFIIISDITSRLKLLTDVVEKTGKGAFPHVTSPRPSSKDEVGMLIEKFNGMEVELAERDIEIKAKNEELLQSRKLAAIGTLASGVAHEINNPLNNIYISAQVLQRESAGACTPEVKEIVGDIVGETARVKKIVGDLLEFARGREPSLRRTDLVEFIKEVYGRMVGGHGALGGPAKDVRFEVSPGEGGISAYIDPAQMERVFVNLFTNALYAMSGPGTISARVSRSGGPAGGSVKIEVSDTGQGISPDDLDKVFDPFFTTKEKGTGLGLAISFNIIKKHHGDVEVKSEKDKGTTFIITLPEGGH